MDWQKQIESLLVAMMDCIESSISTISTVSGRKMFETFITCCVFLVMSILFKLLSLPIIMDWFEVLPALLITLYFAFKESVDKAVMKSVKKSLTAVKKRRSK